MSFNGFALATSQFHALAAPKAASHALAAPKAASHALAAPKAASHALMVGSPTITSVRGLQRNHFFAQIDDKVFVPIICSDHSTRMWSFCHDWLDSQLSPSRSDKTCSHEHSWRRVCRHSLTHQSCMFLTKGTCNFVHIDFRATSSAEQAMAAFTAMSVPTSGQFVRYPTLPATVSAPVPATVSAPVPAPVPVPVSVPVPATVSAPIPAPVPVPVMVEFTVQNIQKISFPSTLTGYVNIQYMQGGAQNNTSICSTWLERSLKRLDDPIRKEVLPCASTHPHPKIMVCVFHFAGRCRDGNNCQRAHITNAMPIQPKLPVVPTSADFANGIVASAVVSTPQWNLTGTQITPRIQAAAPALVKFYKTIMCNNFLNGECKYSATRCRFAHHRSQLEVSPDMQYRIDFLTALNTKTLPNDFFKIVYEELVNVLSEPINLRLMKNFAAKFVAIDRTEKNLYENLRSMWWNKWNFDLFTQFDERTVSFHDFEALLSQWASVRHLMRSSKKVLSNGEKKTIYLRDECEIEETNDFALFGPADNLMERHVLALYELSSRRCRQNYLSQTENFKNVIGARLANEITSDDIRKRFVDFIHEDKVDACNYHDAACHSGGHCGSNDSTFINLRIISGVSQRKIANTVSDCQLALDKLMDEYETMLRTAIALYKETSCKKSDLSTMSQRVFDSKVKTLYNLLHETSSSRSLPYLVNLIGKAERDLALAKSHAGICPVALGYAPLCIDTDDRLPGSRMTSIQILTESVLASRAKKQLRLARKQAERAAVAAAEAEQEDDFYIGADGEEYVIPKSKETDIISDIVTEEPVERARREPLVLELTEDEISNAETVKMDNMSFGISKKEQIRLAKIARAEIKKQEDDITFISVSEDVAPIMTHADKLRARREQKAMKLTKEQTKIARQQALKQTIARAEDARVSKLEKKHGIKMSRAERLAEEEAELKADAEAAASAASQRLAAARLMQEEERIAAEKAEQRALASMSSNSTYCSASISSRFFANDSDDSDSDDDNSEDSDDDFSPAGMAIKQAEADIKTYLAVISELSPKKRTLTEEEEDFLQPINFTNFVYTRFSNFIPLNGNTATRFVFRQQTTDNNGISLPNKTAKPMLFGPFKTMTLANAIKDEFQGMSVTVDTLERILKLEPTDRIQPCSAEFGFYLKINVKKPTRTGNIALIQTVVTTLLMFNLCTIQTLNSLSVSLQVN